MMFASATTGVAALLAALALGGGTPRAASAASETSPAEATAPAIRTAFLPVENLSGAPAPLGAIREALREKLEGPRLRFLDDAALETFMEEHRMRYIGGVAREMGAALREEMGAEAVLVTSLDLYQEKNPPRIAVTARLISTPAPGGGPGEGAGEGSGGRILWMDGADRSGDESPGFLGLGRLDDLEVPQEEVLSRIAGSLALHLEPAAPGPSEAPSGGEVPKRFRPRSFYRLPGELPQRKKPLRVAVLPFANESTRRHAGDLVTLQIVRYLVEDGRVEVVEPGVVREALLRSRLIQEEGLSLPQSDLLRSVLGVDVVIFGEVTDYVEPAWGETAPEVDFSVRAIDTSSRQVIWSSTSHARGDDGILFFGLGRVPTAYRLSSLMARGVAQELLPSLGAP